MEKDLVLRRELVGFAHELAPKFKEEKVDGK
jgi:hypothetical protein